MDVDLRVAVVLLPLILAGSWAVFNIAQAALKQIQGFFSK
jgi:photosystem II PsbY protein